MSAITIHVKKLNPAFWVDNGSTFVRNNYFDLPTDIWILNSSTVQVGGLALSLLDATSLNALKTTTSSNISVPTSFTGVSSGYWNTFITNADFSGYIADDGTAESGWLAAMQNWLQNNFNVANYPGANPNNLPLNLHYAIRGLGPSHGDDIGIFAFVYFGNQASSEAVYPRNYLPGTVPANGIIAIDLLAQDCTIGDGNSTSFTDTRSNLITTVNVPSFVDSLIFHASGNSFFNNLPWFENQGNALGAYGIGSNWQDGFPYSMSLNVFALPDISAGASVLACFGLHIDDGDPSQNRGLILWYDGSINATAFLTDGTSTTVSVSDDGSGMYGCLFNAQNGTLQVYAGFQNTNSSTGNAVNCLDTSGSFDVNLEFMATTTGGSMFNNGFNGTKMAAGFLRVIPFEVTPSTYGPNMTTQPISYLNYRFGVPFLAPFVN